MKIRCGVLITIVLVLVVFNYISYAQNVSVRAVADTNNVLIGDQIKLILEARSDKKTNIILPAMPDSIGKLEILSRSKIDTLDSGKVYSLKQSFVITSFDSGTFAIPPFVVMYAKTGMNQLYAVQTDTMYFRFNYVPVDTSKAIKDIKPPLAEGWSILEYLPYILIGIGIIALALLGYFLWKKFRKEKEPAPEYDPKIPPHVIALAALKQLDDEKLWQKGKVKLYHIQLTEIIRTYIERRFKISALEMITSEIIQELEEKHVETELVMNMKKVFEKADLVKFAKHEPLPDENTSSMTLAVDFVNRTILIVEEENKTDDDGGEVK